MKTIALFGGSGATGRRICEAAPDRGFRVRGFVRSGSHLLSGPAIDEIQGSLESPDSIGTVLRGSEAVVIVFGPRSPYIDLFCADATSRIVAEASRLNIERLICQTGAMIGDYRANRSLPFDLTARLFRRRLPKVAADRERQERVVRESGLRWTLVKPPRLTEAGPARRLRVGPDVRVGLLSSVSRQDLAQVILRELVEPQHILETIFIRG